MKQMKQRSKATISIYRLDEPIAEVLITPNSKVVYNLMEEHSMTLAFDSDKAYYFTIGDYVDDEIFGRFYIAEEQMPTRSGTDYQYNLRLVAWYWLWNNKRFMLTQNRERKECSWHLTNTLSGQLDELLNNLRALGYSNPQYNVEGCADADKVQLMSYNGIGICDALKQMASKWNCEWWVTRGEEKEEEGFTIWFGKCSTGEIVDFTEGENVESMSIEKNSDTYANKIYVFGGKENIPPTYRKTLIIEATYSEGKYTLDKKLEPAMFNTSDQTEETISTTFTLSYDNRKNNGIQINGKTYNNYIENGKTLKYTGERKSIKFSLPEVAISADEITVQGDGAETSYVDGDGSTKIVYRFQRSFAVYIRATVKINGYRDDTLSKEVATSFGVVKEEETQFEGVSIYGLIPAVKMLASDFSAVGTDVQVEVMYGIAWNEGGYGNMGPIVGFADVEQTLTWAKSEDSKNNSTGYIPVSSAESSARYMKLIVNVVGDVTSGYDIKFYNSSKTEIYDSFTFTIDDNYTLGIPTAYYQSEYDNPASLYRIGERRLQLPVDGGEDEDGDWVCENGYIVKKGLDEKQIADMAVVFDDVHPTGKLYVNGIYREERNTITVNDDGSKSTFKWYQYHLNLASVSGEPFRFKKTYILDNETLRIKFLPPTDIQKESCKLSGMTFECGYNTQKSVQNADTGEYVTVVNDFAVVRNEEYGAMLPNEVLKPSEWDPCYLTGWNVKALGGSGIIAAAEEELMWKGFEYAKAIEEGQFTFRCSMMSDRMMTDGLYDIGQKVRINHASLKGGKKESRIIGYEYKLDIPYDTPKYIVGETEAYSRIKKLEKEITKITQ